MVVERSRAHGRKPDTFQFTRGLPIALLRATAMRISLALRRLGMVALALTTSAPAYAQDDGQPRWTARPLFGETDVYVLPKGTGGFVFELRPLTPRSGSTLTESAYRAEFGLPARFQLGLHATGRTETGDDIIGNIDAQALELRWGLASWGRIWGNPTLHVEWQEASRGADVGTVKLLLGGGIASRWRWGSNVAWAQEASGAKTVTRAWTAGVSYEGGRFASLGVETRIGFIDRVSADGATRTGMARELLAGPSLQIRPVRRLHVTLAPLFGATASSPRSRATLLAGWEF
jgi:hypothetical protein